MDAGSIERLLVRHGEKLTIKLLQGLDALIARNTPLRGLNTRVRILPWGTIRSSTATGGRTLSAPLFRPAVRVGPAAAFVQWTGPRALIGGVAPTIEGVEIFTERDGRRPGIFVARSDFENGEVGIYFRVTVDPADDFRVRRVEPVAHAKLPPPQPFIAHKLALFLRIRGNAISYKEDDDRALHCGVTFLAVNPRPDGRFAAHWASEF